MHHEADHKADQEQEKQHFRYAGQRGRRNSKAENRRDYCDNQEHENPIHHVIPPLGANESKFWARQAALAENRTKIRL